MSEYICSRCRCPMDCPPGLDYCNECAQSIVASIRKITTQQTHPEDVCYDCGGPNVVWFAPSQLWNLVVRQSIRNQGGADPMLCPRCFILRADAEGVNLVWCVSPENHALNNLIEQLDSLKPSGLSDWKREVQRALNIGVADGHRAAATIALAALAKANPQ